MPEGIGYGPQFTASVGKTLNYIGRHAYAYSGAVSGNNTEFTVLEFETNSQYIEGFWRVGYAAGTYRNYDFRLLFNDIQVEQLFLITSSSDSNQQFPHQIIIPPFTKLKVLAANTEDSTTQSVNAIVTGKIYGKVD